jgi:hypothetical protein
MVPERRAGAVVVVRVFGHVVRELGREVSGRIRVVTVEPHVSLLEIAVDEQIGLSESQPANESRG